ncbi:MAG: signal peptide peptidase SppA, partial [Armatimonadota bacterium]
ALSWLIGRAIVEGGPCIGVVRVTGFITAGGGGALIGGTSSESVIKQLRSAARDDSVKVVLLRINSPGGSAAASQEVYHEVRRLRTETRKKVIASMGDVAASGAYYIASAADRIVANGSSLTGSIGVVMELPEVEGLLKRYGINLNVVKSGPYKDIGNPARKLTDSERQLLSGIIADVYGQFVDAVAQGRRMPRDKVLKIADGRVFTGRQALALGLVDHLGNWQDAVALAAKEGGLPKEPRLKEMAPKSLFTSLLGADASARLGLSNALLLDPRLLPMVDRMLRFP